MEQKYDEILVDESRIEDGIEYNTVTNDSTQQDNYNEDSLDELMDDTVIIENLEVIDYEDEN